MKGILDFLTANLQKRPLAFLCAVLLLMLGYEEKQRDQDKLDCNTEKQTLLKQLDSTVSLFIQRQQDDNKSLQDQNDENIRVIEFLKDHQRK